MAVIKRPGPGISPGYYEHNPCLLSKENTRKIEPKESPSCLIPCLLVLLTLQLEILVTTLQACILCLYFLVSQVLIQCQALYINKGLSSFLACCPWSEVHDFKSCIPFPSHLLVSLFQVIYFKLLITLPFFEFPKKVKLSGVDCIIFWKRVTSLSLLAWNRSRV